jgi:hypothetical protein
MKEAERLEPTIGRSHSQSATFASTGLDAGFDSGAGSGAADFAAGSAAGSAVVGSAAGVLVDEVFRESLMYHPDPLKTTPTGWITRRTLPAQDRHVVSGSSLNRWTCSKLTPQSEHW